MPAQTASVPATPITADGNGDQKILGNGQPDSPQLTGGDGRTTAIFPPPRTDDRRSLQPPQDDLDEALMESFPCSDPPSHSKSHA